MSDLNLLQPPSPLTAESLAGVIEEAIAERGQGMDTRTFSEFDAKEQADLLRRANEISSVRNDIIQRGQALYNQRLRAQLETTQGGKFLVIDVDTGNYEIDENDLAAIRRAQANRPDAPLYLMRIGAPAAYRLRRSMAG